MIEAPAASVVSTALHRVKAVLFDLDGTLVDSAPDLAGACNDVRADHGLPPLPYERLRPMVGAGARGMVGVGFSVAPGDASFEALRSEFLNTYEQRMTRSTQVFEGVRSMLAHLDAAGLACGIVTNKATRFAAPLVAWLELDKSVATAGLWRHHRAFQTASCPAAGGGTSARRGARRLRLRGRRSARRRSGSRGRYGDRRRGLGLSRLRRTRRKPGVPMSSLPIATNWWRLLLDAGCLKSDAG